MQNNLIKTAIITFLFIITVINLFGGDEFQVNTYTELSQEDPSIAIDAEGNFVIVWTSDEQDGSEGGIYAQRFDSNCSKVGDEFQVNAHTDGRQEDPSVAMNASGNFVIVWIGEDNENSSWGVYAQRYDSDGSNAGGEIRVNDVRETSVGEPSVAMDSAGDFVVVWPHPDGSYHGICAQRFDSYGNKVDVAIPVNTYTDDTQERPSIAMDTAGNFIITWDSIYQDGDSRGVYAQRFDIEGNRVGNEFLVNTTTDGGQWKSSVAMNASGNFIVTWETYNYDGSGWGIFAQRYSSTGNKVGDEFLVNSYTDGDQLFSSSAMDNSGNFIIAWYGDGEQDSSYSGVYAQRFDNSGSRAGDEFLVNVYSNYKQTYPSVAMNGADNFVIAWASFGQDGSRDGIYARQFGGEEQTEIEFSLNIEPEKDFYKDGDNIELKLDLIAPSKDTSINLYFVMLNPSGNLLFAFLWDLNPVPVISNFTLPANFKLTDTTLLNITISSKLPPISASGTYTFAIAATEPGTLNFISNIATVSFTVE
ncbi:hypothetical protein KKB18_05615 [bacterium]|nr:hypothetical protein [bacterium]